MKVKEVLAELGNILSQVPVLVTKVSLLEKSLEDFGRKAMSYHAFADNYVECEISGALIHKSKAKALALTKDQYNQLRGFEGSLAGFMTKEVNIIYFAPGYDVNQFKKKHGL